ncbi:hypothetical protein [Poseidonibacter ostreae]|uniref:Uncharacterized protein n=1 Tax=Poseidonibacter ostreae TaxID=2654171 RepID=A0A6L4WSL8_9BACT|nr:hypothetical protein [Poseidonibacter ostreae]KAB7885004.1 hypothetical protein GA417_09765 [Poseidonibacter ostreae]KAB7888996.1 hypothetical protein GBG19_07345 [Poseidonibacter ostreae]KAB7891929.1 hypothetical protein GBG18_04895 [Poseidonibacter ostreae]
MSKKDRLMKIESFLKQSIFLIIGFIISLLVSLYDYILTNEYSNIFVLDLLIYITILLILNILLAKMSKEYIKKLDEIAKEE